MCRSFVFFCSSTDLEYRRNLNLGGVKLAPASMHGDRRFDDIAQKVGNECLRWQPRRVANMATNRALTGSVAMTEYDVLTGHADDEDGGGKLVLFLRRLHTSSRSNDWG